MESTKVEVAVTNPEYVPLTKVIMNVPAYKSWDVYEFEFDSKVVLPAGSKILVQVNHIDER